MKCPDEQEILAYLGGSSPDKNSAEIELQESNRQLRLERKALQESNAALRAVLSRIEDEKKEIYRDVHENVNKVLLPILHELAFHLPKAKKGVCLRLLRLLLENHLIMNIPCEFCAADTGLKLSLPG